ncbi:kinesin-like protein KIN-4C [Populus alba x Populus x berolinensis]|uniref:Kinesin-like protein KIN-4C n=1 Tax=Populus alba x Populus x berolinensis TaxID=444605 RepID=A0AAD6RDH0_9ROSI|nr:kinesin-like protein KIN-4C [Populus alba x Populus x berolinensis]
MENSECVRVAVNIRPLITPELLNGCTDIITVVPGEPQVQIGSHSFTYDYVYKSTASPSSDIFNDCVAPLVEALLNGYNATVLAYGQTGSGKTYTMGTSYTGEGSNSGIIPKVMDSIFKKVETAQESTEFLIRVSFIEIFKEEVFDLLDPNSAVFSKAEGVNSAKPAVPARVPIQIRETVNGGITLAGVTEAEVRNIEEMASYLSRGSLCRATGSTNMNSQSSRSHAIFTITMEQKKISSCPSGVNNDEFGDDMLCAKLHLVDLAGSERAKRTGADGMRFKEGIHINKGLLALGNVISALGDEKKRKEGGHIPYRDSKLTRLLQDSLGGNSKTVMIACVSPADTNAEETLNTLKYANRARNIQNKAVVNRDPMSAQMQRMRSQIEQLQAELLFYRGDATIPFDELQILKHKVSLLEGSNAELQRELHERQLTCEHWNQRAVEAQVEKDKLIMQIESARNGKSWDEIDSSTSQDYDLVKKYVSKIQELEGELLHLKNMSNSKCIQFVDYINSDDERFGSKNALLQSLNEFSSNSDTKAADISDEVEDEEKELEHSSLQEKLDWELKELDRKLEQKEAEMKRFTSVDTSVLKQHYEKKVHDLEQEKRVLQKEIGELRCNLVNISSTSDDGAKKLKDEYLQKLTVLEAQVAELKKKQDAQAQLLRQKQKSDEAARRLHEEIQRIKTQKVQLQHKIKQESEQFRLWKASREKEVLQLKKEGRRNEYEMHKLLALNQRQKMVLQRKTEEASMATKRLKELLESRKIGVGNGNGPGIQALMQAIEHELEVTLRIHEVRSEYERQLQERARMANEVARLKEEAGILKQTNSSDCSPAMSPGARNSRIFALENMLAASSSTLVSMASQLSEAEEHGRGFSGRGRWNQVRSLADAKNVMSYLFNIASSTRCLLRDKEVDCREKDTEIRDLKEKVVKLTTLARHLEMQKAELFHQVKLQSSALKNYSTKSEADSEGCKLDMHRQAPQSTPIILDDMDTSESEHSDNDLMDDEWVQSEKEATDDEWVMSGKRQRKKINIKNKARSSTGDIHDPENSKSDCSGDAATAVPACCACSKYSLCKTSKCQCRASGGCCGASCGCMPNKCSNRGATTVPDSELGSNETENNQVLASHGAMLLESALVEKPRETSDDSVVGRKPLSDIGNTMAKSNAPNANQRKKWRKSVIQLVPVPPPTARSENTEAAAPQKADDNGASEADIPLKLPRAMRSAAPNTVSETDNSASEAGIPLRLPRAMRSASHGGIFLRDRNADQAEESINKETAVLPTRSPARPKRTSDEKENYGR